MTNKKGEKTLHRNSLKTSKIKRRKEHNKYVTDKRQITAIFIEISQSLENFLQERMCIDDKITSVISAFVSLSKEADI